MKSLFKGCLAGALLAAAIPGLALAQTATVKLGQIEAQTGPNAIYGYMPSQGVPIAVDEINKAGGFKVGDTTYKLDLIALDTRGDPKEATIQLKKLLEQDKVKFVFGPFLSNVFVTIFPYAKQFNGKFLMMGGGTRIHEFVGKPGNEFVIRTWNWDAGPKGFGEKMVDYLIKTAHPKKVAMLFQNDSGGKILGDIYEPIFKARGIETMTEYFEPGTKDFSPVLAKIAEFHPDYLFPGYSDAALYDIVRQSIEGNYSKKFFLVRGSTGPGTEEQGRPRRLHRLCAEGFRGGREEGAEGQAFHRRLQGVLQARLPLRSGAAVFVVLLRPRLHAGRGDAEGRHRRRRREDPHHTAFHDL